MISTDFGCLIDAKNKNTMNDQVEHFIFFCTFNQFPDIAPMSNFDNCRFSAQLIWREGGYIICVDASFYQKHKSEQYQSLE